MTMWQRALDPDGRAMRGCGLISGLAYVTLLWACASVLVLTLPPATAAAFAALRRWNVAGEPPSARAFVADARGYLRVSYGLSALYLLGALVLGLDVAVVRDGAPVLLGATLAIGLVVGAIGVHLWPSMFAADTVPAIVVEAVNRAVRRPARSVALVLAWAAAWTVLLLCPGGVLIVLAMVLPAGVARLTLVHSDLSAGPAVQRRPTSR